MLPGETGSTGLLGRENEQRAIEELLAAARLSQSGVLVLSGEAGIGKSALLDYAAATADGFRLLRVTGTEPEQDLPFAGLAQLLRPLARQIEGLPAPQAAALGIALALQEGATVDRFAVSAGVLSLLTRSSEDGPLALVVDDAHLVDRPSAEAVVFTCRRLLADAVLVLVAARTGADHPWLAAGLPHRILSGLDPAAAGRLAAASSPVPLTPHRRQLVLDLADGNPLALRELPRYPDRLAGVAPDIPVPVPTVVVDAFGARLDTLEPGERTVLLVAAVAAGDLTVVARVCEAAGLDLRGLERAEALGLLETSVDRVEFSHSLVRSAVYAAATTEDRRRVHAFVADALPIGEPDRRAWHRCEAALGPDPVAADEIEQVAVRATRRGAHAVAATAHERAARLSTSDKQRAARFLAAGEAAWFAGEDRLALGLLEQALRYHSSPALDASARLLTGLVAARGGSLREARDILTAGAESAAVAAPEQALRMYAETVDVSYYLLDIPAAIAAADGAERLLAQVSESAAHRGPAAVASIAVGMARILAGEPGTEPLRAGVERLAHIEDEGFQSGWEVLGPLFLRESGTGRELISVALQRGREAAAVGTLPHLLYHLARDDATTDRWSQAAAGYGEAISLAREFGQLTELGASLAGLTWLTARQARLAECRRTAEEAMQIAEEHRFWLVAAWTRFALAELDLSLGDTAGAVEAFTGLDDWLTGLGVLDVDLSPLPELVEALCRSGRPEEARPLAARHLRMAERKGQPWSLARAARVRGLLAETAELDGCFTEALAHHDRTLDDYEEARTRLVFGERLRRARRRVDARAQLGSALDTFQRLGAEAWADVALAELNATGLSVRRRETGPVVDLTARELQIALLLADGKTTREAAAALFLSPKTVEYHLRHVYTKLGVGSRAELAEHLKTAPAKWS